MAVLNERARILLGALVERYIEDGQPVGSRTLAKHGTLNLSPASIRNIMADLEEVGFITSPHTSAGRIPTPKGYRFFVDSLLSVNPLQGQEIAQIQSALTPADPQRLLATTSHLLSELTQFTSVVVTPRRRRQTIRQIEFLRLSDKRVLLIIVTSDHPFYQELLTRAANFFNQHYAGLSFEDARPRLARELRDLQSDISQLMEVALQASNEAIQGTDSEYVVSGEANLLRTPDLATDMDRLRKLFGMFEQKTELLQLLDIGQNAAGVQIYIGSESGVAPLDECTVITAPYARDGEVVGTLGVIGPTRMDYERVIPIVDITARLLSNALSFH